MKLFLKNTILFFCLLYGSIFALVIGSNYIINSQADFTLKPHINKIVLGNSHPTGTFNDSLISNFKNLADPGDNYFYGYQKLKKIIKQNPQVDTVYVEFNPKTILLWEDSKLWKKNQIPNYQAFFNFNDHYLLASINSLSYQQDMIKGLTTNVKRIATNQYNFKDSLGGFRHVKSSYINVILDTLTYKNEKQFKFNQKMISRYDLLYLSKMVDLCQNKNIQIILVRSPYHKKFDAHRYETIFQIYRMEHFKTIPFLDFMNFPMNNWEFKDLEHLNFKGARKFSLWFEEQNL